MSNTNGQQNCLYVEGQCFIMYDV